MQKILVVDDDAHIRDVVCFALRRAGYQPLTAGNGRAALEVAAREMPALVVLDILMPELDGTAVCTRLRARSDVPVIFLTSKDEEMDRILGLELGADDYVVKPFSPRELVARVKAVLRRKGSKDAAVEQKLTRGQLSIDAEEHVAAWAGSAVALTATEFALLKAIAAQPRRVRLSPCPSPNCNGPHSLRTARSSAGLRSCRSSISPRRRSCRARPTPCRPGSRPMPRPC